MQYVKNSHVQEEGTEIVTGEMQNRSMLGEKKKVENKKENHPGMMNPMKKRNAIKQGKKERKKKERKKRGTKEKTAKMVTHLLLPSGLCLTQTLGVQFLAFVPLCLRAASRNEEAIAKLC